MLTCTVLSIFRSGDALELLSQSLPRAPKFLYPPLLDN